MNCTLYIKLNLKEIFALCKVYLKSSQCQAKMPHKQPNSNQPKHHSSRFAMAHCLFTYMHKTSEWIHPQETMKNGLVSLVLSFHHLFDHRLNYRAFLVTKNITRTRLNLSVWVSVGSSPSVMCYVSRYSSCNL